MQVGKSEVSIRDSQTTNPSELLAMANSQPLKRSSIQGAVQLKRGSSWVQRFASIKECVFSYKKDSRKYKQWRVYCNYSLR